jgi:hypothetical protein
LPFFAPPFSIRNTKRVEDQQKRGPSYNSAGNGKKRREKGCQKGLLSVKPSAGAPFFHPFSRLLWLPFFIACSLGAHIVPQRSHATSNVEKRTGVNFSEFYSTLSAKHEKGRKKGSKKGAKRGRKRVTVNNPIDCSQKSAL